MVLTEQNNSEQISSYSTVARQFLLKTSAFTDQNDTSPANINSTYANITKTTTMDEKLKQKMRLDCIYDMFRDKVEEDVIYIVFTENEGKIDLVIDQLMTIAACSFTGYDFATKDSSCNSSNEQKTNSNTIESTNIANSQQPHQLRCSTSNNNHLDGYIYNSGRKKRKNLNKRKSTPTSPSPSNDNGSNKRGDVGPVNLREADCEDDDNDGDDPANEDSSISINVQIEKLQNSIDSLLEEKNQCHEKATQYLAKKMYHVTSYYSDLASQIRRMIEVKTDKLVELLLKKSDNSGEIDLHGLNPIQASMVVRQLLKIRQDKLMIDKQGETTVDIITGWGKHTISPNGHKIKPTIVKLLRDECHEFCHLNKGALRITLRR